MNARRRRLVASGCAAAALALARPLHAAIDVAPQFVAPGFRPPEDSDEAGMWTSLQRSERALADSRFIVREPPLAAYCREIACRLLPGHCADVRAYVVPAPRFSASLAPTGMLQVTTGMLLRCRNEAELAAVVAHEAGHYLLRHAVQRWRETRSTFDFGSFWSFGFDVGGVDAVGVLNDALIAAAIAYTPEQERAADALAVRLMAAAGYPPPALAAIVARLAAESRADPAARGDDLYLATHPDPQDRSQALERLAATAGGATASLQAPRYRERVLPLRPLLIDDELALRHYARSAWLFDSMLAESPSDGELWFAQGEVHRLRSADGDITRAIAAYERAREARGAPPELYRSLGIAQRRAGRHDRAAAAFAEYLKRKPAATDRDAVRALLSS